MKKYTFFFLFTVTIGLAQQKPTPPTAVTPQPVATPSVSPKAPEITFTETAHDFGTVKKGSPIVYQFKFKNTGKESLIIFDCKAGCHCTTPKCPKEAIKPGKTGIIEVHYDSMRVGNFNKEVIVNSNAKTPHVSVNIKGMVAGEVEGSDPKPAMKPADDIKSPVEKNQE